MFNLSRASTLLAALTFFIPLCSATLAFADTVPPQLAAARLAAEQGQRAEAIPIYGEFIASHPLMQSVFVRKDEHLPPSQVHDLLLAFAELTDLQRLSGDEEGRRKNLDKLDWLWRNQSIGSINLYHLARIYLDNGRQDQGLKALEKIADDQERFPEKDHNKVYLRACAKLLKIHSEQERSENVNNVLRRMRRSLGLFNYDLRDRYKIARLFLEQETTAEAEPILAAIAKESDPSVLRVEEFTVVQAAIKLLGIYAKRDDGRAIDLLLQDFEDKFADRPLTSRNRYLLALAIERAGRAPEARRLLEANRQSVAGSGTGL